MKKEDVIKNKQIQKGNPNKKAVQSRSKNPKQSKKSCVINITRI